jgi:hypothetical protein
MRYTPLPSQASTVEDLRRWVTNELQRIATSAEAAQTPTISVSFTPPAKPAVGQLAFADGTQWDPGSGRGLYYYDGVWVFIA